MVKELLRIKRLWVQMLFGVVLFFPLLLHLRVMGPESSPLEERKKREKNRQTQTSGSVGYRCANMKVPTATEKCLERLD